MLSKKEWEYLDRKLDDNQKIVLNSLAEIHEKNPQNPWASINTLGAKIGGVTGTTEANIAVIELRDMGLVGYSNSMKGYTAISDKGLDYVKFKKISDSGLPFFKQTYFWFIVITVCFLALVIAILTREYLWLITSILGPIISYIFNLIFKNPNNGKGN